MIKNLYYKLRWWWVKRKYKMGEYFYLEESEGIGIEVHILKGMFKGTFYGYTDMCLLPTGELSFKTRVYVCSGVRSKYLSRRFLRMTTDIFRVIITEDLFNPLSAEEIEALHDEDRIVDTSELDEERALRKESVAVPKRRVSKPKSGKKVTPRNKKPSTDVQQPANRKRTKAVTPRKKRPNGK